MQSEHVHGGVRQAIQRTLLRAMVDLLAGEREAELRIEGDTALDVGSAEC
jgi:hypothetical protein